MKTGTFTITEKHSIFIRWTHWLNFPLLGIMLWSGVLIYWANDVYRPFFPSWFYRLFSVDHRLAEGMSLHFFFLWPFILNGVAYLLYLFVSGHWRELVPTRRTYREALEVTLHDLGLRRELPSQGKFNAAQRLAYTAVTAMGVFSVLSGLAIYKPVQLSPLVRAMGGYEGARLFHFILAMSYVPFFLIHVIQVARAGWNNFRSMIAGFEVKK